MARRPKRINLEAISDSTHKNHKKHVMALVEDLLRKHPRGPSCTYVASDYRNCWSGHPKLVSVDNPNHAEESCGYDDLTLYRFCTSLNIDGSEWDFRYRMNEWYPDLGKNGVTRRSRRLAHRIEGAYRRTRRAGRPGIYRVKWSSGALGYNAPSTVFIHAENPDMAKMVAKCSIGPSFPNAECEASFEEEGCPSTLMGKNTDIVKKCENLIKNSQKEIKKLQESIKLLELRAAMVQTYSISAVGS